MPRFLDFSLNPEDEDSRTPTSLDKRDSRYLNSSIDSTARGFFGFYKPLLDRLSVVANNLNNNNDSGDGEALTGGSDNAEKQK